MKLSTEWVIQKYKDVLFRIAYNICQSESDADDAVQECFIKYHTQNKEFDNEEHIKAWLIRVTINLSKNMVSSFWHRNTVNWEEYMQNMTFEDPHDSELFKAVMQMPQKYRIPIHLFYYEDYSIKEIAEIIKCPENTVKSQLDRGRKLLKQALKEEWEDE